MDYEQVELPTLELLAKEMKDAGFEYHKCKLPPSVHVRQQAYFHRTGSEIFGWFNEAESTDFVVSSFPILKKYDSDVKKKLYKYDID